MGKNSHGLVPPFGDIGGYRVKMKIESKYEIALRRIAQGVLYMVLLLSVVLALSACTSSMTASLRVSRPGQQDTVTSATLSNGFPFLFGDNQIEFSVASDDDMTSATTRITNGKSTWGSIAGSGIAFTAGYLIP